MVGTPYRYGGAGPRGFDCSGLVYYSYRQAGIAVPRTTGEQYRQSQRVKLSHLQPGGEFRDRFRFSWYESGHMMYLRKPDLATSNNDLREFIRWAIDDTPEYPLRAR